ncbi:MAG: AAA family ATPase [Candidatus Riflebacteria bacterium]|nr:AAA family ATPase [Candidatus Riflebacteria bacterium]
MDSNTAVRPAAPRSTGADAGWRLEVTSGPLDGQSWRLRQSRARLGSGEGCDFSMPQDQALQPEHATLEVSASTGVTIAPMSPEAIVRVGEDRLTGPALLTPESDFVCGSTWLVTTRVRPHGPAMLQAADAVARLDEEANRLLSRAARRAESHGQRFLGAEHLALELVEHAGCSQWLSTQGVSAKDAASGIERAMNDRKGDHRVADLVFTPRVFRVLSMAAEEAKTERVRPAHLLAALLGEGRSFAARALAALGTKGTPDLSPTGAGPGIASGTVLGPLLTEIGRNLTALAAQGKLPPLVGRQRELRQVLQILGRSRKNNPIVVGEAGIGKTCLIEGVAQRAVGPDAPPIVKGKQIVEINPAMLVAGTQYRGQFEQKVVQLVQESSRPDVILFIDEIHLLVGAGRGEGSMMDAGNMLKPALARGEITVIGATTHSEFRKSIEKDAALERRFDPVFLAEPLPAEAIEIVRGVAGHLEKHHGVHYAPEALEASVHLSVRYLPDRHLPDKAIDLLDRAAARRLLATVNIRPDGAASSDLGPREIGDALAEWIGRPVEAVEAEQTTALLDLEARLASRVLGQSPAIDAVASLLRASRAGLRPGRGPVGVFMFLGPTGVGKTELARALAEILFGTDQALVRLDMSEFQEKHSVSRLIGAPPGYVGHEEGGVLTEAVRRRPSSVVLFDEVEKACPEVFDLFLQIFDEGRLTDGQGRTTDLRGTVLILTSNLRPDLTKEKRIQGFSHDEVAKGPPADVRAKLKGHFKPELLNRIDEIVFFSILERAALVEIMDRHLAPAREQLARKGSGLDVAPEAYDWLAGEGKTDEYGARELARCIQRHLSQPLAKLLLTGATAPGSTVAVRVVDGALAVSVETR